MGSQRRVEHALAKSIDDLTDLFSQEFLTLASNSVVLCSVHRVAKQVAQTLKVKGIVVEPVLQASYLGVDTGAGKRLSRAVRRQRVAKAKKQSHKLRRPATASKKYLIIKNIEQAGPQAGASYGSQVYGVFGEHMLGMRRRLAAASGSNIRGRCITTILDLRTPGLDPG
eukprot:895112-Pyramimonas_sp.AAC.1